MKAKSQPAKAARVDWRTEWGTRKSQWVEATWLRYMRAPWLTLYAYYTPSNGAEWGILFTVAEGDDPPAGGELITAERIPAGDKATIARWLEQYAGRLPVIGGDL